MHKQTSHLGPWADDGPDTRSPQENRLQRALPNLKAFAKAVLKETDELKKFYVHDPKWVGLNDWAREVVSILEDA